MKALMLSLMLTPLLAVAEPLAAPPQNVERPGMRKMDEIAQKLQLTDAQRSKLQATFKSFAEQRKSLHQQVKAAESALEQAANGDAASLANLNAIEQQLFDARSQMQAMHRQMLQAMGQDLSPQQRAKLDLIFARPFGGQGRFGHRFQRGE